MKVFEHKHPLKLIDLQLQYEEEEAEEDDEEEEGGDGVKKEGLHGVTCYRCGEEIHMYHRYYYKCSSCDYDFSLHKFCAELPTRLEHVLHSHPLIQEYLGFDWSCSICKSNHTWLGMSYGCCECGFRIDVNCATEVGKKMIHHPSHPHLLICAITKPILCECSACGKRHEGVFFQCTTCTNFTIHSECAFLPEKLLIQERTDGAFYHTHPLTISYSFSTEDQRAKHDPRCRVCANDFFNQLLWIYKCDKCLYYAHLDCAIRVSPDGLSKTIKNFEDTDHPGLVHFPFPDETYSIPKHYFFQQTGSGMFIATDEVSLQHISHQHPLILVDTQNHGQTSSSSSSNKIDSWLLMCHNPMKKTQLLCNACVRPIMSSMPFYICDHQSCNFALHEWCTRLPPKIENHPTHPQHTLLLNYSNVFPHMFPGVFYCDVCLLPCNGFAYCCVECKYNVDVSCGFIPKEVTHQAHLNHILSLVQGPYPYKSCIMCLEYTPPSLYYIYKCNVCYIYMHPTCAFLIPKAIRHTYDKHPMLLSYLPIENHKSEYFCEICEYDLNPHKSFYHCQHCAHSIHATCAPLILQSETETHNMYHQGVHIYVNIKFGGIHNTHGHPHPLSFAQGTVLDGPCIICGYSLQYELVVKCLNCKFAVHCRKCLNKI